MKLQFYKYRTEHSSGVSKWEYVELYPDYAKTHFNEMAREWDWSEHFRGITYKKIKSPPKEWFEEQIKKSKRSILHHQDILRRYSKFVK